MSNNSTSNNNNNSNNKPLVDEEMKKLIQQVIGGKQTIMGCAIARIYTSRFGSKWVYSNLCGVLCLVWDREKENTPFLRLFDVESLDLLFEVEMYIDFNKSYTKMTEDFYFFDIFKVTIGIQFASTFEAQNFCMKVLAQSIKNSDDTTTTTSSTIKGANGTNSTLNQQQPQKGNKGIFHGVKKFLGFGSKKKGFDVKDDDDQPHVEISKPIGVTHESSLQLDLKSNQVDFSNLNDDLKLIFHNAGITQADLNNKELAQVIFESVLNFQQNVDKDMSRIKSQTASAASGQTSVPATNNQPAHDVPVAPVLPIPKAPVLNIPTAPVLNIPTAPVLNIPTAPVLNIPTAPVLNIPTAPVLNINVPTAPVINLDQQQSAIKAVPKNADQTQVSNKTSMLDQIKAGNFQLKRVEVKENKANLEVQKMDEKTQDNLSAYLSKCIAERRKQLRKNHYSSSENSSSSDDD